MASLKNFVISLFRWLGKKNIAQALRQMAATPRLALQLLRL